MSIIRGANRRNTIQNQSIQILKGSSRQRNSSQMPTQMQFDQMVQQMKSLMKQNTKLKHENLQLKQKLMLAKIELENTKLHNQQNIIKLQEQLPSQKILKKKQRGKTTQFTQKLSEIDSSSNILLKFQSQDFGLSMSAQGKQNEFCQYPSKQITAATSTVSYRQKYLGTPRYQPLNVTEHIKRQSSKSSKYTKKDQILNKYRKFISGHQNQNQFIFIKSIE